jgi:hypothetical protein
MFNVEWASLRRLSSIHSTLNIQHSTFAFAGEVGWGRMTGIQPRTIPAAIYDAGGVSFSLISIFIAAGGVPPTMS